MYRLELPSEQAVDESDSSKSGCVRSLIGAPFFERPLHLLALFAARTNVSSEVEFIRQGSDLVIVVAFVEAEILWGFGRWFRSVHWDAFERLPRHFEVVPVGSIDGEANWNTTRFNQDASLGSQLGPVGRIGAGCDG